MGIKLATYAYICFVHSSAFISITILVPVTALTVEFVNIQCLHENSKVEAELRVSWLSFANLLVLSPSLQ